MESPVPQSFQTRSYPVLNLTPGKLIRVKESSGGVRKTLARMEEEAKRKICRRCGSPYQVYKSHVHGKGFCSRKCREVFHK